MSKILLQSPDGAERHLVDADLIQTAYDGWALAQGDDAASLQVDMLRAELWGRVKRKRDSFELGLNETILTADGPLQIDEKSQARMMKATKVAEIMEKNGMPPFATTWTMADNSEVPITIENIETWGLIMGQQSDHVFAKARGLREALDAAHTIAELEAINIDDGWLA